MRHNTLDLDHLKYLGILLKYFPKQYELKRSEFEILLYLQDIRPNFTQEDFRDGKMHYSWNKNQFMNLVRSGWYEVSHKGNRRLGEVYRYSLSSKAKRMLNDFGKTLDGRKDLPLSIRNKVLTDKTYSGRRLARAIILKEKRKKL